jgi:2'-5' RNA ligase
MIRSVYDDIWDQFVHGDHVSQMPHREGIGLGLGIRVQTTEVVEQVRAIQRQLEQCHTFAPSPLDTLHITVRNLGALVDHPKRAQEVSPRQLPALTESIGRVLADRDRFPILLNRVNSFFVCPIVEVHDAGHILSIREQLEPELVSLGLADYNYGPRGFIPHLTLGYYTESNDGAAARQVVNALRDTTVGTIQVTELILVRARLTSGLCCLEQIHAFKLR